MYNLHRKFVAIVLLIAMTITLSSPLVVNAGGPAAGGNNEEDIDNTLQGNIFKQFSGEVAEVSIKGPDSVVSGPGATASYVISTINTPTINVFELELEFDGDYLSPKDFTTFNGFYFLNSGNLGTPIFWKQEANIWIGKALLMNPSGISGDMDIMQLNFDVQEGAVGDAGIKLNYVILAYAGYLVDSSIVQDTATTSFIKYYSPYDINKDGVVDALDISLAVIYLVVMVGDPEWEIAKFIDFDQNWVVDINDLILILANFTVPFYGI